MFIPKRILYAVGGLAVLIGSIGSIGIVQLLRDTSAPPAPLYPSKVEQGGQTAAVVGGQPTEAFTPSAPTATQLNPSPVSPEDNMEERIRVVRIVDGDTIEVEINGKIEPVRYIGIDTPETVDPRKPVQCFGVEASKRNKELVEGKMVRLEKDVTDRDKYNRLLRYIWLGDTLINQTLVEQGFAKSYSYPPDIKYQDKFVAAERKARENKLGLWAACISATPVVSTTPTAASSASATNPSCTIKGNISASGEKIYHLQGCGSYSKTTIDERRGEQWFCLESEAESAGWRKALNCP